MQSVGGSLPPLQHGNVSLVAEPKKPDEFLDSQAKGLVNLDSLVLKSHAVQGEKDN